ncbi:alpha-mannosyltransferase, glycosyltransferase family 71 protein [Rhodotorula toruloides]|uniref:Alpha-mannosyltransferase, glycosyltransferase family 71 protein n=1 Tax=Rhodotorula toruloides TaxID=5286 RepID=A0A511K6W8_RHOTO|nr:alpha-mannosyltransferase, glycosyltransferase family 71 protein [Rhodotorula toruloides]
MMRREVTSVASFREGLPSASRSSRRGLGRRLPLLLFAATICFALTILLRRSNTKEAAAGAADLEAADQQLLKVLVRTKEAIQQETPLEDLAAFADRAKVLMELDEFGSQLNETYPRLNASTKALYSRSVYHHHQQLLQSLYPYINKNPQMPRTLSGLRARYTVPRGIIVPVGNDQFIYAVHLLATIVHTHGVNFPIHVVYAGNDDLVPEKRAALRSISPNIDTVDILNYFDEEVVGIHGGGWAIKVFAILASPFQEVIIADADAVFVQNPEVMFDDPGYNATGTLFFRDREIFPGDGQVHEWFHGVMKGREPSAQLASSRWWTDMASREEMESGVVVFDKRRTSVVYGLLYAGWLNTRVVREEVTYKNTYGDKESFWMAFELCGLPYHLDREYAGIIGQLTHTDTKSHSIDTFIQSDHLFHLDHKGRPLWWNGSLFQEKRVKDRGYLIATHWAPGTVDWICDTEPWSMRVDMRDVRSLQSDANFTRVLTDMIGSAIFWEGRFPQLLERHYATDSAITPQRWR